MPGEDCQGGELGKAYNERPRSLVFLFSMSWQDHISIDPQILVGKPVVKGTRIAVELVVELMANGWTQEQILENYPNLTAEDIRACLSYASEVLH